MQYGTHFLDLVDDYCTNEDPPPHIKNLLVACDRHPTNTAPRISLLRACEEADYQGIDIDKQKFNINTLVILHMLSKVPEMQKFLLAAQMGLREEIFQLNELLWRWITSRSASEQRDDPKRMRKLNNQVTDKIIMLNAAINKQLEEQYLAENINTALRRCLQETSAFSHGLAFLQE